MATPNMNLTLPLVSQTPGPLWASQINADLSTVDSHDHTPGKGAAITPASFNINGAIECNSNAITGLQSVRFDDQLALVSTNTLYTVGGNLYFNNGSSTPVQVTLGGSVNAGAGSITGLPSGTASVGFNSGTGTFTFVQATNTAGVLDVGTVKIRSTAPLSNSINITAPATAGYTLTLPVAPPVSGYAVMAMAASGTVTPASPNSTITLTGGTIGVGTITGANIGAGAVDTTQLAQGAVTSIKMAAAIRAETASSGTAAKTNTSWADVFLASATITTTTVRPIVIQLQGDDSQAQSWLNSPTGSADLRFRILTPNGTTYYRGTIVVPAGYKYPGCLTYVFIPTQTGTHSFNFQGQQTSGSPYYVYNCILSVYQL